MDYHIFTYQHDICNAIDPQQLFISTLSYCKDWFKKTKDTEEKHYYHVYMDRTEMST